MLNLITPQALAKVWPLERWKDSFTLTLGLDSFTLLKQSIGATYPSFVKWFTNTVRFSDGPFELKQKLNPQTWKDWPSLLDIRTPSAAKAMKIIRKYWTSLQQTRSKLFPYSLLCYRSNRNIKSYLVWAKLLSLDPNSTTLPWIEFSLNGLSLKHDGGHGEVTT